MSTVVSSPASAWQSPHGRALPAPGGRTLIMGVLNATPDSFSDGGELPTAQAVVERAGKMLSEGADVLDLGGESTRPGAAPVSVAEEMARVLPALEALRKAFPDAPISIDTYKTEVATAAVKAGADIINDIWGATHGMTPIQRGEALDAVRKGKAPAWRSPMAQAAASLGCPLILMHNRPEPKYANFWEDVLLDLRLSLALASAAGVARNQIWFDPGFGFAKGPAENLEVLKNLGRIVALGYPVLLGASRKSTLGRVLDTPVNDRVDASGATVVWGVQQGCHMVRAHDIAATRRFARMADAIKAGLAWTP